MRRRGCGLGCIVAGLGLLLVAFLLPYLVSSIYSMVSSAFGSPTASTWLWGDWLGTMVDVGSAEYMILAEGPICCVGIVTLLIVILGMVMMISGLGRDEAYYDEEYEPPGV